MKAWMNIPVLVALVSIGGLLVAGCIVEATPTMTPLAEGASQSTDHIEVVPEHQMCDIASDCAYLETTNCSRCSCGASVNAQHIEAYYELYKTTCSSYRGPECESPVCVLNTEVECVEGRCVIAFVHASDMDEYYRENVPRTVGLRYPNWEDKGPITDGWRATILSDRDIYRIGEEVRISHVLEVIESVTPKESVDSNGDSYWLGPKPVYGEFVDGDLMTETLPGNRSAFTLYVPESVVWSDALSNGAVDYNFEVTTYEFSEPAIHEIQWVQGDLESNVIIVEIVP